MVGLSLFFPNGLNSGFGINSAEKFQDAAGHPNLRPHPTPGSCLRKLGQDTAACGRQVGKLGNASVGSSPQPGDTRAGQVSSATAPSLTEIQAFRENCGTSKSKKGICLLFKKK